MKKQKIGLSAFNWILSILGILLLSCIIILPPVFRKFMNPEVVEEPPQEEVITATTTCQKENLVGTNYTDSEILSFTHQNQKLQEYTRTIHRTFTDSLIYQEQKLIYSEYVTAFSMINGYEYSATPSDDTFSMRIQEKYDLTTFKPTTIVIPGDENPTAISASYELNSDISTIKENLIATGYTCSDNETE